MIELNNLYWMSVYLLPYLRKAEVQMSDDRFSNAVQEFEAAIDAVKNKHG